MMVEKYLSIEAKELRNKMQMARYVLSQQINFLKAKNADIEEIAELSHKIEILHEMEKLGVKNLSIVQLIKVARIIEEVESLLPAQEN